MDSKSPPPEYDEAMSEQTLLASSTQFQIQTTGVTFTSSLSTRGPDPIGVFRVQPGTPSHLGPSTSTGPEYISLRLPGKSNSCALVRGSDPNSTAINSTIYRWGYGRCPRIRMFPSDATLSVEESIRDEPKKGCEVVDVKSKNMFTRGQVIETSFGKFLWRYGSRSDRKEAFEADNLLILDRTDGPGGRVAQMVRSGEFRTPGTDKNMMGNGGRLMMDLRMWAGGEKKESQAAQVEAFVIAGCLCMLKKEVDRMREGAYAAIT